MHKIKKNSCFRRENIIIATISYLIIFITFYVYQNIVIAGLIFPLLGGGFTFGVLLCLPFLFYEYIRYPARIKKISFPEIFFFIFLLNFFIKIAFGIFDAKNEQIICSHAASIVHLFTVYLLARLLPVKNNKRVNVIVFMSLIIIVSITFLNSTNIMKSEFLDYDYQLNYQAVGFTFLAVLIYAVPNLSLINRFVAYFCALPVLFIVGARAELISFFLLFFLIEFLKNRKYRLIIFSIIFPFSLIVSSVIMFFLYLHYPDNRVFALFNIKEDQSYIERKILNEEAITTICSNPFYGDYASYDPGLYAHNILSIWVDLGFPGFLLICGLFFSILIFLIRYYKIMNNDTTFIMSTVSFVVVAFLLITAKAYFYPLLGVAIGLFGRLYAIVKIIDKKQQKN